METPIRDDKVLSWATDLDDQTIFSSTTGGVYSTQTTSGVQHVRVGVNMHF